MNDSIQILNKNGDMMSVEGIAHIVVTTTNKKYLFYTLNEKVDNDLTKIYIAEESDIQGGANPINDAEWEDIRKKMVKISHKEELPDVSYLPFGENAVNVGEAKKLAVTSVAKQAFKDAQATHTISTNQSETPAVSGNPAFFANTPENESVQTETNANEQNIFNNPPAPVSIETQAPAPEQMLESQVNSMEAINQSAPVQDTAMPQVADAQSVAAAPSQIIENEQIIETAMPTTENNQINEDQTVQPMGTTNIESSVIINNEQKEIISDEDALKAIEVIQDYIAQEEAA